MLDFLWHLRGSVRLDGRGSNQATLDRLGRLLEEQRKPISYREADHVAFDAPLWSDIFGPSWHAMVLYDQGRLWIDQGLGGRTLRYDFRSLHAFVFCLFGAAMFFAFGWADGGLVGGFKLASLAFGWVYGMNIVLALLRIPTLIRKAVRNP